MNYSNPTASSQLMQLFSKRALLFFAGGLACLYAFTVLVYVQTIPDLGLPAIFGTSLKKAIHFDQFSEFNSNDKFPIQGDKVTRIGDLQVRENIWPDILQAPFTIQNTIQKL